MENIINAHILTGEKKQINYLEWQSEFKVYKKPTLTEA
jgi:hypothetical protein